MADQQFIDEQTSSTSGLSPANTKDEPLVGSAFAETPSPPPAATPPPAPTTIPSGQGIAGEALVDGVFTAGQSVAGEILFGGLYQPIGSTGVPADGTVRNSALCSGAIQDRHISSGGLDAGVVLVDGTLSLGLFAESIQPVQVVSSLPACTASETDQMAFLTTDNQLYQCDGSAWQVMTPDGSNIVANSITAGQIAAGAIGTDELAANSVTAGKIGANQVFARNIVVGSFDNLITNPTFENDSIDGDDDPHEYDAGTGGSWGDGTGDPRAGTRAARFDRDSQTDSATITFNGGLGTATDMENHAACSEGDEFYFEFYAREQDTGPHPDVNARIFYLDESGATVSSSAGNDLVTTTSYQKASHSSTAPAGSAFVAFRAVILFDAGDASTAATLIDAAYARRVVDDDIIGTVSAEKILAGEITVGLTTSSSGSLATAGSGDRIELGGADPNEIRFYDGSGTLTGTIDSQGGVSSDVLEIAAPELRIDGTLYMDEGHVLAFDDGGATIESGALTGSIDIVSDSEGRMVRFHRNTTPGVQIFFAEDNDWIEYRHSSEEFQFAIGSSVKLAMSGSSFNAQEAYDSTTASAANVFVASDGQLQRSTSSERYKSNIRPVSGDWVLDLEPAQFRGSRSAAAEETDEERDTRRVSGGKTPRVLVPLERDQIGLTSENVAEANELAAVYDGEGRPDGIDWNAVVSGLVAKVKEHEERLNGR